LVEVDGKTYTILGVKSSYDLSRISFYHILPFEVKNTVLLGVVIRTLASEKYPSGVTRVKAFVEDTYLLGVKDYVNDMKLIESSKEDSEMSVEDYEYMGYPISDDETKDSNASRDYDTCENCGHFFKEEHLTVLDGWRQCEGCCEDYITENPHLVDSSFSHRFKLYS